MIHLLRSIQSCMEKKKTTLDRSVKTSLWHEYGVRCSRSCTWRRLGEVFRTMRSAEVKEGSTGEKSSGASFSVGCALSTVMLPLLPSLACRGVQTLGVDRMKTHSARGNEGKWRWSSEWWVRMRAAGVNLTVLPLICADLCVCLLFRNELQIVT